jgi:hypothetical protein
VHIEFVVEDSSGAKLLGMLVPELPGLKGSAHTWRIHAYKGIGRIPPGLAKGGDPAKRILLDQLPRLLRGYVKTPGIDAVVVVLDTDKRDCKTFLQELKDLAARCGAESITLFRLAIEELEAWYLGDRGAVLAAFPHAKMNVLAGYVQDSPCDTWELLANAVHPGGAAEVKRVGWPLPGQLKHEWAEKIGPYLSVPSNSSPSFCKFRDGVARLVEQPPGQA